MKMLFKKEIGNEWKKYWEERTRKNSDWYGKRGRNADEIIKELNISKKDILLDIGCANGSYLSDIYKKTKAKCYGIDISEIAINLNKSDILEYIKSVNFLDSLFNHFFRLYAVAASRTLAISPLVPFR